MENLSVDAIHQLIASSNNGKTRKTKEDLIEEIKLLNDDRLSMEEISQLSMMTVEQLSKIVERLISSEEGDQKHNEN